MNQQQEPSNDTTNNPPLPSNDTTNNPPLPSNDTTNNPPLPSTATSSAPVVDTNTINLLQNTIQNVQASFGSVYSTLAMNLKQSLEMTQTMNSVMEQFLQSSIKINTKILQSTDTPSQPTLVIAITNTSQFPIHNVSGQISFQPPSADLEQPSPPTIALTPLTSTRRAIRPPTTSVTAPALFMTPPALTTLVPLTRHTETVRLVPSVLAQFNATVTLRFPSPGTGKALGVEHGFGVYLADQLSKYVHPSSDPVPAPWDTEGSATLTRSYPVGFLREIMCFNPAFGVEAGMWVGLVGAGGNGKTVSLTCLIRSIDLTHSLAECAIYETGPVDAVETGGSKLAGRLVMELDVLARVEGGDSEVEGEGA